MTKTHVALVAAGVAAACTDLSSPRAAGPAKARAAASSASAVPQSFLTLDDELAAIASAEPSFAGVFLDSTHTPVVLLTDATRLSAARAAGVDASLFKRRIPTGSIRVQAAAYGFGTFERWYDQVLQAPEGVPGLTFTDIDEVQNRLHFGVATAADQQNVRAKVAQLGVPLEAVAVDVMPPAVPSEGSGTIEDSIRPLRGGLRIADTVFNQYYNLVPGSCTLGFTAHAGSSPDSLFFFTASHCSRYEDYTDGVRYYQNSSDHPDEYIGYEIEDRQPWTYPYWGCPSGGYRCRFSEVSKNLVAPGVDARIGFIARTYYHDTTLVADTIANPGFYVTGLVLYPLAGQTVWKVGRRSGLSSGPVTQSCVQRLLENTTLLCQFGVDDSSGRGDSGAPVFEWGDLSTQDSTVGLAGILWGHAPPNTEIGRPYYFSPMNNIYQDLGGFQVVAWQDPTLEVTVTGPDAVLGGTYTWTANPSGGIGNYTYQWQYRPGGSTTWYSLGTGQSHSLYVDPPSSQPAVTIWVTVQSDWQSAWSILYVDDAVAVDGPTLVWVGSPCTWTGSVTTGTPPYTFEWDVYGDGAQNPVQVHYTNSSSDNLVYQTQTVGDTVTISLTVADAGGSSASRALGAYSGGYGCGY